MPFHTKSTSLPDLTAAQWDSLIQSSMADHDSQHNVAAVLLSEPHFIQVPSCSSHKCTWPSCICQPHLQPHSWLFAVHTRQATSHLMMEHQNWTCMSVQDQLLSLSGAASILCISVLDCIANEASAAEVAACCAATSCPCKSESSPARHMYSFHTEIIIGSKPRTRNTPSHYRTAARLQLH